MRNQFKETEITQFVYIVSFHLGPFGGLKGAQDMILVATTCNPAAGPGSWTGDLCICTEPWARKDILSVLLLFCSMKTHLGIVNNFQTSAHTFIFHWASQII